MGNGMRFSEREGFKAVRQVFQVDSVDEPLRNSLWNAIDQSLLEWAHYAPLGGANLYNFLWTEYYKLREDHKPEIDIIRRYISDQLFKGQWYEIYDFIEFALENYPFESMPRISREEFVDNCNYRLEREMSAYRIVDSRIARITSEEEIASIEKAAEHADRFEPVSTHIKTALAHLSRRDHPDYRNSIKEAISAVESMCAIITGKPKATLGDALKQLEASGVNIHPALRGAFTQMYGYTSDARGIRHGLGLLEEPDLDFEDSKFMLVSCSAFVNLLKARTP
jgi:hypothetical protein